MHRLGSHDVGRILRTFKIKKNVEVTDNGKIII
ncbi:helicase [Eggerthella lenta]|nr:helicase [Eggerthella lenta]